MTTNAENRNQLSRLLGGDATSDANARTLLAKSPFNLGNLQASALANGYSNVFFEPFNRIATIPGGCTLTEEGTTTSAATYSGRAIITSDDVAAKTDQLTATLMTWTPNTQPADLPLICQIKFKTGSTITASEYWVGMTDGTGASVDTDPIALSSTSTFTTSVPTDGVYAGYSATPTSGSAFTSGGNQHTFISISTNANTIVAHKGGTFVAATDYTYTFFINSLGDCEYFLNNQSMGTQTVATDPTKALGFMVCAAPRTTVSAIANIDYIFVAGV